MVGPLPGQPVPKAAVAAANAVDRRRLVRRRLRAASRPTAPPGGPSRQGLSSRHGGWQRLRPSHAFHRRRRGTTAQALADSLYAQAFADLPDATALADLFDTQALSDPPEAQTLTDPSAEVAAGLRAEGRTPRQR